MRFGCVCARHFYLEPVAIRLGRSVGHVCSIKKHAGHCLHGDLGRTNISNELSNQYADPQCRTRVQLPVASLEALRQVAVWLHLPPGSPFHYPSCAKRIDVVNLPT